MFTRAFLLVVSAYARATGLELRTVSSRLLNDGKVLPELAAGTRSMSLDRAEKALAWFSQNWPEGADWPADVPRPEPAQEAV